jgi:hypothetical protein
MARIQTLSIACLVQLAGAMSNIRIDTGKLPQTLHLGNEEKSLQLKYGWTLKAPEHGGHAPGLFAQPDGRSKQQAYSWLALTSPADPHDPSRQVPSGAGASAHWHGQLISYG